MYRTTVDKSLFLALTLACLLLTGCDSTEPIDDGPGEGELITRVVLTLNGGGQTIQAEANDPDGDGTGFQIDTINLQSGVTYLGTLGLFDVPNGTNIGLEVANEAETHQVFYTPGEGVAGRMTIRITDADANGLPLGLAFELTVAGGGPVTGTLNVVLSHFDGEVKTGTNRSSETDMDVTFPVQVQ